ncbi:V-type proton ATPase subunit G [Neolecta irregularis DAH-3]|uniref:V-type proton ATPase subunit G n=1 Tax=Neolecta irregularis (strain DAH-3) TaxID=1198029 RepID=A0A1U7LQH2_NEOID|nr:V-type proton ATPase subunit G [Neolecta irregularis DAH-3]|eukprot:OLL24894.1 V-type proton ATPase subunit G [Neolecta irregularis DAH-3]
MSAANSRGIQTLLEAEKEAQKIVHKAREYRTQRLKDARSEAAKEIEAYKKQKDLEFQNHQKQVRHAQYEGKKEQLEAEAQTEIKQKLDEIRRNGIEGRAKVVDELLKAVVTAEAKPHRNFRSG